MQGKTTPKAKAGRARRKKRWIPSVDGYHRIQHQMPVIDRKRPGEGYRHLLQRRHVMEFVALLPNWGELSSGLEAIVLAPGEWDTDGWWEHGVVAVCAWEAGLWTHATPAYCTENRQIMDRLDVPREDHGSYVLCKWTEGTARAYQLLDVMLHELGHHHDHMTTRSQRDAARGEPFAAEYARRHADVVWDRYMATFGLD